MMKIFHFLISGLFIFMAFFACKPDKQARLAELKKKHDKISEQIRQLESELSSAEISSPAGISGPKIAVKEMVPSTFKHYLEVQGKLDGEENLGVNARTMGVVTAIYVKMGDRVTKDQVLAQLDDALLQQNLKNLNANLGFVNDLYEKQKKLWDQKIGSEIQYLTAKNNKESLENNIKVLQDQIEMTRIKSPINGTVEDVAIRLGQSVSPGFPLIRVVNFTTVKVVADIAESYSSRVNPGDEVQIYFPDLQKEISARISSVSRYIGPQNRTFQVEVRIRPEFSEFKANMIAVLKINDYKSENTYVLPINLVQNDQDGSYVFLAEKSNPETRARKVRIKTGQNYNGLIEITEGLKEGDLLITAGYLDLQDGQPVRL